MEPELEPEDDRKRREVEADRWWSLREQNISHSKEYGIVTVRSLILIHGAAIIATLTFLSNLKAESKVVVEFTGIKNALIMFVVGLLFSIISGAMGYFNFQANAQAIPGPNELRNYIKSGDVSGWKDANFIVTSTVLVAVLAAAISFVQFALGAYFAVNAFVLR